MSSNARRDYNRVDRRPVLQGPDRRTTLRTSVTTADPAVRAKLLKTVQLGRVGKWMRSRIIRCGGKPEHGLPSSPLIGFLLMLFNTRLGWWLGNPRCAVTYRAERPTLGVVPLAEERAGQATDSSRWVYLSDGGHFENLGLYEMVRRRCRRIVVSRRRLRSQMRIRRPGERRPQDLHRPGCQHRFRSNGSGGEAVPSESRCLLCAGQHHQSGLK
jgi:hypothetical protein